MAQPRSTEQVRVSGAAKGERGNRPRQWGELLWPPSGTPHFTLPGRWQAPRLSAFRGGRDQE